MRDNLDSDHTDPLSEQLWGLKLSRDLPWALDDEVRIEWASVEDVLTFMEQHYPSIFGLEGKDSRFLPEPMSAAKLRFLALSDRLVFRDGGRAVGVLTGNPHDWSTYYWRTVAFLPEYQGRGLLASCLERTDEVMRAAGVDRVEGEAAPINYRQVRLLHRLGYCVTGQSNSERFGALLRLTKYLSPTRQQVFASRFCS